MAGKVTTHALDAVLGCGASGMTVTLSRISPLPAAVAEATLDGGGRAVLFEGPLVCGQYELTFDAAGYHRRTGAVITDPPFLAEVPIRFGVADPAGHYHVPLLLSPHSYSTYRGG